MAASRARDLHSELRLFSPTPPAVAILLLAFAVRLFQLGAQSLWYDEAVTLFIARQSVPALIAHTAGDIHPPLYYLLMHVWLGLAGASEFSAAFFSLFFGVLLVSLTFRLTRDGYGVQAAVIVALLLAVSSFNLWYSQEVRMYTLAGCLAVISVLLALKLAGRDFQLSGLASLFVLAAYILVVALGLYTHYYFAFLWAFEYLAISALLMSRFRARAAYGRDTEPLGADVIQVVPVRTSLAPLLVWQGTQLLILLLFAPWLPTALRQVIETPVPAWRSFVAPLPALAESFSALSFGQSLPLTTGWPLMVLPILLVIVGAVVAQRSERNRYWTWMVLGATLVPLLFVLLASLLFPLYHVRYVFIYAAFFYVVLALALQWFARRSLLLAVVLLGIMLGGSIYAEYFRRYDPSYAKDDYRSAVRYIAERARPGDAVLINAGYIYPAFVYYYPHPVGWRGRLSDYAGDEDSNTLVVVQTGSLTPTANLGWGSPESDFYAITQRATARGLNLLFRKHARVWVLRANDTVTDPDGFVRTYLQANALEFDELNVPGESFVKAQGFIPRTSEAVFAPNNVSATFGQRISLLGWSGAPTVTAASTLKLSMVWKAIAPVDVDYHASLSLFDSSGKRWASNDGVPVGEMLPTREWLLGQVLPSDAELEVPEGTPPGEYTLQLSLYDPTTLSSLAVPNGADDKRARLGRVQVVRASPAVLAEQSSSPMFYTQPVIDDWVALERYGFAPGRVRPGEAIHAELMWRVLSAPKDDADVFFQMLDDKGRLWAAQESPPVEGHYPTLQWTAGEFVRDARDLIVPPDVPDGRYRVVAGMYRANNRERLPVRSGWWPFTSDSLELGTIDVKGREHVLQPPGSVGTPVRVRIGGGALLIGYAVQMPSTSVSRTLTVTLNWQAIAPMNTPYKVFLHLVGTNQQIVAQRDSEPGDGTLPTTGWYAGEYLTDRYVMDLRSELFPGEYSLYVGLYDPKTNIRLPIFDTENKNVGDRWLLRDISLR